MFFPVSPLALLAPWRFKPGFRSQLEVIHGFLASLFNFLIGFRLPPSALPLSPLLLKNHLLWSHFQHASVSAFHLLSSSLARARKQGDKKCQNATNRDKMRHGLWLWAPVSVLCVVRSPVIWYELWPPISLLAVLQFNFLADRLVLIEVGSEG